MKTQNMLILAGVGIAAFLFLRPKKAEAAPAVEELDEDGEPVRRRLIKPTFALVQGTPRPAQQFVKTPVWKPVAPKPRLKLGVLVKPPAPKKIGFSATVPTSVSQITLW